MRLRTKLALAAMALTCAIVLMLSFLFVAELLGQRIEQTSENNEVLARQVLNQTRAGGGDRAAAESAGGPERCGSA